MYKLCKWIYDLGYRRGWEACEKEHENRRRLVEAMERIGHIEVDTE